MPLPSAACSPEPRFDHRPVHGPREVVGYPLATRTAPTEEAVGRGVPEQDTLIRRRARNPGVDQRVMSHRMTVRTIGALVDYRLCYRHRVEWRLRGVVCRGRVRVVARTGQATP